MAKKHTIPRGGGTVLCFCPADKRLPAVPALCMLLKIRCRAAGPEDSGKTVGAVMGLKLRGAAGAVQEGTPSPEKKIPEKETEPAGDAAGSMQSDGRPDMQETGPEPTVIMTEPMLVFCGVPGSAMDYFLTSLRSQGIQIPLKAALTETNIGWPLSRLYRELAAEHEAMTGDKI